MTSTAVANCERPLVVRCGAFGDMVLITALIGDLYRRFGRPVDVLTSGPWSEPLLRGQPGVGEIHSVRSRKTPYWLSLDQQRVVRWLRRRGVGPTWFCDGNEAARPMLVRSGIIAPYIVDVQDHPLLPGEHATQQWRRLARLDPAMRPPNAPRNLPVPAKQLPVAPWGAAGVARIAADVASDAGAAGGCHLEVTADARNGLTPWLRSRGLAGLPLLAIQIGNKRTMRRGLKRLAANSKHWPNDRWAAVLRHLRKRHPAHAILLLGTGPEYQLNAEVAALAGIERLHNLADELSVPRLIGLLARADALITVDSGPAHVAAAVDCPQVVLFGKASTTLYRPWGTGGADVKVLTGTIGGEPHMLGIGTADVIAAWDALRFTEGRAACPGSPA